MYMYNNLNYLCWVIFCHVLNGKTLKKTVTLRWHYILHDEKEKPSIFHLSNSFVAFVDTVVPSSLLNLGIEQCGFYT